MPATNGGRTRWLPECSVAFPKRFDAEPHLPENQTIGLSLLTAHELRLLGSGLGRAWPTEETACFENLVEAIDEADLRLVRNRESSDEG